MKIIKFIINSLLIGIPSSLFLGMLFMDEWRMVFMHGYDDFLGLSLLTGAFVIWIYRKFISTGVANEIITDASKSAVELTKILKSKQGNINYKQKFKTTSTLGKGVALTGAANVVAMPIIIPAIGCQVHGAVPKGISQWEIHYSVPSLSGVQKNVISRNSTGFSHGEHWFDIKWPIPFL
jgi:hypothetical protein